MNKFLTKIAGVVASLAMVIGVGVGINVANSKGANEVCAANGDSVTGGDMSNGVTTGWTTLGTGKYSGNGVKFDGANDYIQSPDISSNNLKDVKVSLKAGHNGGSGSVLTIATYNDSDSVIDSETFIPTEAYNNQTTIYNFELTGSVTIKHVRITMTSKTNNLGMKYCEVFDNTQTGGDTPTTYSVSYDSNGGTGTMTDSNSPYVSGSEVTVMENAFTKTYYAFSHWNTEANGSGDDYDEGDTFTINGNTTLYAQWIEDLGDLTDRTGQINFGSADGSLNVNDTSVSKRDNLGANWTVTTAGTDSFTANSSYAQIGSSKAPASSIAFESQNFGRTYKVTSFTAKFGGFSGTAGSVTLKVGDTSVGTGSLNAGNDVTVSNSLNANGSSISVTVTGISKGVKVYFISYTLASTLDAQTITASANSAYTDETITLTTNADSAGWEITENTAGSSLSTNSGKSTVVSASQAGSVTVQATASGYTTVTKTVSFAERPVNPYITLDKDSTSGYSGLSEVLSFTFGNFQASSLVIISDDENVVTVEDPVTNTNPATVEINFIAQGNTVVNFKNGETLLDSIEVEVITSTATISGLPENRKVFIDDDLDLGSLIETSSTGSCSTDVQWISNNPSIASVDENGVVTGVSAGTTTITATMKDYTSATMQCAVKVLTYGTSQNPLNIAQAKEVLDMTPTGTSAEQLVVRGTISSSSYSTKYSNYTIWLQSDDESVDQAFQLYATIFDPEIFEGVDTSSYQVDNSLVGYEVTATGYGKIYNETYELAQKTVSAQTVYPSIISLVPPAPVPATGVTLNKTSDTLVVGDELQLTATLQPLASFGDVTWSSEHEEVATVDDSGLVTAVANGTTTITARVSEEVSAECVITVVNPTRSMNTKIAVDLSQEFVAPSGSGYTYNKGSASKKTGFYQDDGTKDSSINYFSIKQNTPLFAFEPTAIEFKARIGGGSAKAKLDYDIEVCLINQQSNEIDSTKITITDSITTASGQDFNVSIPYSSEAYGVKMMHKKENGWNARYYSFELTYSYANSYATISGNETNDGNNVSVDSVSLRFGAEISLSSWNSINSEFGAITDYGLMLFRTSNPNNVLTVKEYFTANADDVTIVSNGSGEMVNPGQDVYRFSVKINVNNVANYSRTYCAAPYILAGGQYYFLDEMRFSVNTLAQYCIDNGGSNLSNDALAYLAAAH